MRKWTYLVAALLIGGSAATFTGCIDNEEPAGITELRGAKAELLKAKAQVQVAEAAYKEAETKIAAAKAAYLEEKVAQEKLRTALLEAQTEDAKAAIAEEAALRAEKAKAALIAAQQASAEADALYQRALIDIQLQLSTMKNDVYAAALNDLLLKTSYEYTVAGYDKTEKTKDITLDNGEKITVSYIELVRNPEKDTKVSVEGLIGLSQRLAVANNELAVLKKQKMDIEFSIRPNDLTKEYTALKGYWEGVKAGQQEALEAYKKIEDTEITAWEDAYKQLKTEIKEAGDAKAAINQKRDEALVPLNKQLQELALKYGEATELKIAVPAGSEGQIIYVLREIPSVVSTDLGNAISDVLDEQVQWIDGKYVINGGALTFKLSPSMQQEMLNASVSSWDEYQKEEKSISVSDYLKSLIVTVENQARMERLLQIYETNLTDATQPYKDALTAWEKAKDAYIAAADKYKYDYKSSLASRKYDAYSTILAKVDAYLEKTEPADADKKAIKDNVAAFLTQRMELDGFTSLYKDDSDDTKDVTMQAALKDATESDAALAEFISRYTTLKENALGGEYLLNGGLYGKYNEASEALWGFEIKCQTYNKEWYEYAVYTLLTPVTYDLWNEAYETTKIGYTYTDPETQSSWSNTQYFGDYYRYLYNNGLARTLNYLNNEFWISTNPSCRINAVSKFIVGDGLANDYFMATYLRDNLKEQIANSASYQALYDNWMALIDANKVVIDKYNADAAALEAQKAELESTAEADKAKYDVIIAEKTELRNIMDDYFRVTVDENEYTNAEEARKAFEAIKNKIIDIEGGVKEPAEGKAPVYVKGTLAEADAEIAVCDNFLKALTDKTYVTLQEITIANYEVQIANKQTEIEAIQTLWDVANKKKTELLNALTGTAQ